MKTLVSKYFKNETLSQLSVRNFCIEHSFYTKGDCCEYERMLKKCESFSGEISILRDIATDILDHSDISIFSEDDVFGDYVAVMMSMLDNECVRVTYLFEEEYV